MDTDATRPLDDVLDGLRFAMVTTVSPEGLTARPLTLLEHDAGVLRFLVGRSTPWVVDLEGEGPPDVQVAFADPGANRWVALTGTAGISVDRALLERLWTPAASVFFSGADDPDLAALEVEVEGGGAWWDGPSGRVGRTVALVRAALSGDGSRAGDHGSVDPG